MSPVSRAALLSFHTCPLDAPGEKNAGGMNVYVRHLADKLGSHGIAVDVFTRSQGSHQPIVQLTPNVRVIHIQAGPARTVKEDLPQYVDEFATGVQVFAREHQLHYDVIHAHYWLSGNAGLVLRDAWNVPLVATFHTLAEAKRRARVGEHEPDIRVEAERRISDTADALLVSTSHEQQALELLYDVHPVKVAVLAPGIDLDLFKPIPSQIARRVVKLKDRLMLLFVGRLDPLKGLDVALHAMSLLDNRDQLELVVVGGEQEGKNETSRLQDVATMLGLQNQVRFVGMIPHEQLPYYYSAAEMLLMPSYYESFCLAALEAMACGTPVVAARVGGLPAVVKEGETGFLVPWHCPEPFAQRIEVLLHNKDLRDSMGRAARAHALTRDWSALAQETLALYNQASEGSQWAGADGR